MPTRPARCRHAASIFMSSRLFERGMPPGSTSERSMRVKLEYGKTGLEVTLPDDRVMRTLAYKNAVPLADPVGDLKAVLEKPNGTPSLAEVAKGRKSACILICDVTRPVPNEMILTPVLETIEAAGV